MKAGRELDALVAEKVMGWEWRPWVGNHEQLVLTQTAEQAENRRLWGRDVLMFVPHYSTDIAAAWELVEKFRITVTPWSMQGWIATVEPGEGWYSPAETAPHAICLAALHISGVNLTELLKSV